VDAAVSKDSGLSASAAVARDEGGNFLGASALVVEGNTDAEVVEAIACREGLAPASDLGLQATRLASDCANAVQSV
jgi:ribonuclease HI